MDDLSGISKMELRFHALIFEENPLDKMYVYWRVNGEIITPAILKNISPFTDLETYLQRQYGRQSYTVFIRRGGKIILKYVVHIGVPLNFSPEKNIRAEIEGLRAGGDAAK